MSESEAIDPGVKEIGYDTNRPPHAEIDPHVQALQPTNWV